MPDGRSPKIRPGQERYLARLEDTPLHDVGALDTTAPPESQWKEAWKQLRKNPLFYVSAALLVFLAVVIAFPGLFTSNDPSFCQTGKSLAVGEPGHPLGFDRQGCDVYSRMIYGARASVAVGVFTTLIVALLGLVTGAVAGFYGGFFDSLISRIADVFYAIPLLLAAIVLLSALNNVWPDRGFWGSVMAIVLALGLFGWPQVTRISRGAVIETKQQEFVDAARALGATPRRNLVRHVIPNSLAPVIVTATVSLGIFIVAEATLSFLGLGLPTSIVSWGNDIAASQNQVRAGQRLGTMFWPAGALALTVFSFILLGDAVRDALDPKAKKR
ncbi:MAG: ABC transporter permease [Actinomycetales bacterium]|jgi:oligopeptide transport system permease protein|nr:MAG: ABC transporter permease [Actinomycetales bacterium]